MIRKILTAFSAITLCLPALAQDIYKVEQLSGSDLNGDARYVGMGGAMSALGANLTSMGTNPAGIGLYRRNDVSLTGSVVCQPNAQDFYGRGQRRTSFDQAGIVYSVNLGNSNVRFVNFGFNYTKSRNTKSYIGINPTATEGGMSQSWQMRNLALDGRGYWIDLGYDDDRQLTTPLACLGYDTYMIDAKLDDNNMITDYYDSYATKYDYHRVQWGGIHRYDFNMAFNVKDRAYFGLTLGIYDVDTHSALEYAEQLVDQYNNVDEYFMQQEEVLTGTGVDVKIGAIVRPIENSPLRLGLAIHTPTWYNLTASSYLYMNSPYGHTDQNGNEFSRTEANVSVSPYDYNIRTPWKLNLSAATTIGSSFAIDAEYELTAYKSASVSYPNYSDGYWGYSSQKDNALKEEIKACMKPVHTFRIGAEAKLAAGIFGRVGYNYVSAPFEKDAYLNLFTDSPSYYYSTNTDYVNLGAINRVTAGLGYRGKHFYCDVAYQFQAQKGDVYAFHYNDDRLAIENQLKGQSVDLNRHCALLTLGYKF